MSIVIVTGSGGVIGSEAVRFFSEQGFDVVGVDNNMRAEFFGEAASVAPNYSDGSDATSDFATNITIWTFVR